MTAHDATPTPGPWIVAQPWSGFSEIRGASGELVFGLAAGSSEEKQPDDVCDANAALLGQAWTMRFRTIPALAEENARLRDSLQRAVTLLTLIRDERHISDALQHSLENVVLPVARAALARKEDGE